MWFMIRLGRFEENLSKSNTCLRLTLFFVATNVRFRQDSYFYFVTYFDREKVFLRSATLLNDW